LFTIFAARLKPCLCYSAALWKSSSAVCLAVPQKAAKKVPGRHALRDGIEPKNHPPAAKAETIFDMLIGTAKSRALSNPLLLQIPNPNAIALGDTLD